MDRMTRIVLVVVLLAAFLLGGCVGPKGAGFLEGVVTIGPIWPVETPDSPPIPPEVYEARKVMVYDESGDKLVERVNLSLDGHYRVELKTGVYTVDINYVGIDSSADVPARVEIRPGETVVLNIDIDTGIR